MTPAPSPEWAGDLAARVLAGGRPVTVRLCGPQGSGKSTGAAAVARELERAGLRVATLSLDDMYLPGAARRALAARVHPLFATRGVPGTHDVGLALDTLAALGEARGVPLPRFDKGRDEPVARADWPVFHGPADVVLFEGWCVGALPQTEAELALTVNALEADEDRDGVWRRCVNAELAGRYRALFDLPGPLALLQPPSFAVVAGWRIEQERSVAAGLRMSGAGVRRFVLHFQRLSEHAMREMPRRADVVYRLDGKRRWLRGAGADTRTPARAANPHPASPADGRDEDQDARSVRQRASRSAIAFSAPRPAGS